MNKINFRVIFFTEYSQQDKPEIEDAFAVDGFNLKIICVDNEVDLIDELDTKVFDYALIGDPLVNTQVMRVIEILSSRPQKIPYMMLVGSLKDFSAVAALEKTGILKGTTAATMQTLLPMMYKELRDADVRYEEKLSLKKHLIEMMGIIGEFGEMRDKGTQEHTERVTVLTVKLARKLNVSNAEIILIRQGALLHDAGKVGTPDAILLKEGPLTDDEWIEMKKHPTVAYEMFRNKEALKDSLDIPYCHHEKWNGTGYPRGIGGKEIPIAARIFSVCDIYDALTSDRPYRAAWTRKATLAHIKSLSGIELDPAIVLVFLEMMETK